MTPVLSSLHWLPVRFRIDFKLVLFVFHTVNGLAPSYLSEILTVRDHGRALRSCGQLLFEVPRSRLKQWGDRSFAVTAPRLWNRLPPVIRTITYLRHTFLDWHLTVTRVVLLLGILILPVFT